MPVRALRRTLVALGALSVAVAPALPAAAAVPSPRSSEWWFSPWNVEQKVWPTTQGQGVTVAVLDSGVNGTMPEIAGALLPGGDTSGRGTDGRTDFDKTGHGTSMSVLIAGQGGGRTRLVGIAPRAKILPVDVTGGDITTDRLAEPLAAGIRFAVDHDARVINISLAAPTTSGCPSEVMSAIAYAVAHDVVLVAGAGNTGDADNSVEFPAMCPGVLAVGATDVSSRPWKRTQAQDYVSVAAPGVDMPTTGKNPSYYYPHSDGTSNSTALVAGAAALVRAANPTMPAREVVHRLIGTAMDVGAPGDDPQTGYGIVRVDRAVDTGYAVSSGSPNPPYQRFDQWQHPGGEASSPASSGSPPQKHSHILAEVLSLLSIVVALAFVGAAWYARRSGSSGPASPRDSTTADRATRRPGD
ncbi:S8 family serine peptidase [Actinoallomurus acaciae]|uniref:S8 family serine peptidase n=1 Tax=Actinoallomurus acaciae TaxID=502577 RepID=A0ABV5YAC9_9ACTN